MFGFIFISIYKRFFLFWAFVRLALKLWDFLFTKLASVCLSLYDDKHLNLIRKSHGKEILLILIICCTASVTFSYVFFRIFIYREGCYVRFMFSFNIELQHRHCKPLGLEPSNFMLETKSKYILHAHSNTVWLHRLPFAVCRLLLTNHIRLVFCTVNVCVCYQVESPFPIAPIFRCSSQWLQTHIHTHTIACPVCTI